MYPGRNTPAERRRPAPAPMRFGLCGGWGEEEKEIGSSELGLARPLWQQLGSRHERKGSTREEPSENESPILIRLDSLLRTLG